MALVDWDDVNSADDQVSDSEWAEMVTYIKDGRARANHTGTQTASTISDFDTEVSNNSSVTANTAKISYTDAADVSANTTHRTSNGSDHSYINQNVTTTGTPTFGKLQLNSTDCRLEMFDTSGDNFRVQNQNGVWKVINATDSDREDLVIDGNGVVYTDGALNVGGNIILAGTVDGVDIAGSINQAVLTTSSPTFAGANITGQVNMNGNNIINCDYVEFKGSDYIIRVEDDADTGIYYDSSANTWNWKINSVTTANIDLDTGNFWTDGYVSCDSFILGTSTTVTATEEGTSDNDKLTTKGYVDDQIIAAGSGDVIGPGSSTDNAIARFSGTTGKVIQESGGATVSDAGVISAVGYRMRDTRTAEFSTTDFEPYSVDFSFTDEIAGSPNAWDSVITVKGWTDDYRTWQLMSDSSNTSIEDDLYYRGGRNGTWGALRKVVTEDSAGKLGNIVIGGTLTLASGTAVNEFSTDETLSGNSDTAVPTEQAVKAYVDNNIATSNTMPYIYKTTTYTATTNDGLILCNGTFTVTTPGTLKVGQVLTIKNWGTGVITINPDASDKIDGSTANITLNSQYSFIQILRADVDDWVIIGGGTYLS